MLLKDTALVGVSYVSFLLSPNTHTHTHTHTSMCAHTWVWVSESHSVVSDFLWPHGLHSPWNSPGQNIGVGNLFLLQGIFTTQGSNPGLRTAGGFFTSWDKVNTHMRSIYFLWMKLTHKYWTEKRDRKQKEDCQVQPHRASFWGKGKLTPSISLPPTSRQLTFT